MRLISWMRWSIVVASLLFIARTEGQERAQASADLPAICPTVAVVFERDIRPIFSSRCLKCHGPDEPEGGLDLTRSASAIEVGAIVPGRREQGTLLKRVRSLEESERMPPEGERLTPTEIDLLESWVAGGAEWPRHWSYRPLVKPVVPTLAAAETRDWCRTPIDHFIADRLDADGLRPSRPADRRTLLRRAAFDLLGLPPAPEETRAFLEDTSPDAWERCVDRLLASPHYGERSARHWMDLVHFAETHGHDQDRPRTHAWPYRDYLIRSFNADKPYARFVAEQVAGDAIATDDPEAIVATGFLAGGPWDESSLRDIREDSIDREIGRYLDRDDIVTTVMSTFASTSVHCARCHDHKFDPITQAEYYGLQAVFAGIDKANRAYDSDPDVARRRRALTAELAGLDQLFGNSECSPLTPDLQSELQAWEGRLPHEAIRWRTLSIESVTSHGGAQLTADVDGSVLASGTRPDKDVYFIEGNVDLTGISALKLDVLTHADLPMQGPGRQDNGNLHLNEVRIFESLDADNRTQHEIAIGQPFADFNQAGWTIAAAVDRNPNTAWGIFPEVTQPHSAVFPFQASLTASEPTRLRVELHQIHGGGHLIGRFRLAVTDAPVDRLQGSTEIPLAIWEILDVAPESRTEDQQLELARWFVRRRLERELAELPQQSLVYCGTNRFEPEGSFRPTPAPRPVHVLTRGLVTQPQAEAKPAGLACIAELSPEFDVTADSEGVRRAALARWLADRRNPLVWRSIANRIWLTHFGAGLVTTPNDFGQMGATPSHPELLDWLAVTLQESDGSLKTLQRMILTSAVYRQSSDSRPDAILLDAGNRLLWRMPRSRLDAESFHDALLVVSGTLDPEMEGPSVRQFIQTPGAHVTPNVDYQNFSVDDPANTRRSVYRFLFRTIPDPFMEALDCPDASQLTPQRSASLTALQALATLNDKFVVRQSELFAERLAGQYPDLESRIRLAYDLLWGRVPTDNELSQVVDYARVHGLANACRFLLNTNEFLFVD